MILRSSILRYVVAFVASTTLCLSSAGTSPGQSFDGIYNGFIGCKSRSGGQTPLQTPLRMTVTGNTATYEREIVGPGSNCPRGCPTGYWERGIGAVTPSGEVVLSGRSEGRTSRGNNYAFDAEYKGQFGGSAVRLVGVQRWVIDGQAEPDRSCEITLSPPK